ncbi:hypothetical protein C0Q70_10056 [Pomacea canaliculata]|uniref:Uncharacterized protein n=1 Tax=Pomacea canaliculata TaxID=400727 RepID=A0A2T7PBI8_POMCA|nr:hypothetical protein C0Q70_10056 [Pomacea canaliculata]
MKTLTANVFLKGDRKTVQAYGAAALRFRHHLLRMRLAFLPVVLCRRCLCPRASSTQSSSRGSGARTSPSVFPKTLSISGLGLPGDSTSSRPTALDTGIMIIKRVRLTTGAQLMGTYLTEEELLKSFSSSGFAPKSSA